LQDILDRPAMPATVAVRALIDSPRLPERLRAELERRAAPDDPAYAPRSLSDAQLDALRALAARILPQEGEPAIDVAARLDAMMADATGNGWRYEALPSDPDAYRHGLDTLDDLARAMGASRFAGLSGGEQDDLLRRIQAGEARGCEDRPRRLGADQLVLWFEEVRSDAVRLFVAHPAIMARIGYSGALNGREGGPAFAGFDAVGIGEREAFEPVLAGEGAP
jgi:hypothetical protein